LPLSVLLLEVIIIIDLLGDQTVLRVEVDQTIGPLEGSSFDSLLLFAKEDLSMHLELLVLEFIFLTFVELLQPHSQVLRSHHDLFKLLGHQFHLLDQLMSAGTFSELNCLYHRMRELRS